jgi:mannose-6-phosphate isomerase-like protein (cupin superfamily)
MNRRRFLQYPFAAMALASVGRAATSPDRSAKGFRVGSKMDRYDEELLIMGGRFDLKVSGKDTGGDLCIFDTIRQEPGGPALHRHFSQDEWFYMIQGEFIVRVGEDTVRLHPGDSALAPRMIPHAFAMVTPEEGQMLVLFQPAGSMEDFFKEMSRLGKDIPKNQETMLKELWARHGMEILGPPLKF